MQFLYYKNRILHILKGRLPGSVFVWHIILSITILLSLIILSALYYEAYMAYMGHATVNEVVEYEEVLDLDGLDDIISRHNL
jgi:hypothetical protein